MSELRFAGSVTNPGMRFVDPSSVTCSACLAASMQRVSDLLDLRATCPHCGANLSQHGLSMREACDDLGDFFMLVQIILKLEDQLHVSIHDEEVKGVRTLRELAQAIEPRLSFEPDPIARALTMVQEAALTLAATKCVPIPLDTRLVDAVDPDRWNKRH